MFRTFSAGHYFHVLLDRSNHVRNLLHWNQHKILPIPLFTATLYDLCELRYFSGSVTVLTVTLGGHRSVPGSIRPSPSIDLPLA